MKGIILAGGTGSRLWPVTKSVSKQLLPIFDKPIVYYPLSTLMLAGIKEILIITTEVDRESFVNLLGSGENFGISIEYATQDKPRGIAEAFIIGEDFIGNDDVALVLGDNFFYGAGLSAMFLEVMQFQGATIFVTEVSNPSDYGVVELNRKGSPIKIVEKPSAPRSNFAITGLYFLDSTAAERARAVKPSARGELEITEVLTSYLSDNALNVSYLSRGMAWLDTGTPKSLHDASSFVRVIEERTGTKIGCPEEIAWRNGWLTNEGLQNQADCYKNNEYGRYLSELTRL
jgi:glucose-1-phosphate thymidylyltransferase